MKRNKGITMISLVVTIIVLIILAGVSINMVIGDNGIITIAQKAKENTELARIEEEEQLNNLYEEFQNSGGIIDDGSDTEAIEKLENFKKIIATAITNEGVTTAETDTAETMGENISKILQKRTENATATPEDIVEGKTAWVNGNEITGTKKEDSIEEHFKVYTQQVNGSVATLTNIVSISVKEDIERYTELTVDNFHVALSYGHCAIASSGNTYVRAMIDHYDAANGIVYVNTSGYGNISSYEIILEVICIY